MGTSSIKHGKVVLQLDDQVIILLRESGTTFKGINQHTQESHALHCDITHAKYDIPVPMLGFSRGYIHRFLTRVAESRLL